MHSVLAGRGTHVVCGHQVQVVVVAGVEGHDVVNGFISGEF